jgi:hypothetical protein
MQCSDTGSMEAIHIPREIVELAQEIQSGIDALNAQGHGDGEIKLTVTKGKIPFIDWTFRKFRMLTKKR